MQFAHPAQAQYSVALSSSPSLLAAQQPTDVTPDEVRTMIAYLQKARDRAKQIRDRSPAGSYMENVLRDCKLWLTFIYVLSAFMCYICIFFFSVPPEL